MNFRMQFALEPFNQTKCNWTTYVEILQNKFTLHNVPDDKRVPIILDAIGIENFERLIDLCSPDKPNSKSFSEIVDILSAFFEPKPNTYSERFKFCRRFQNDSESVSDFAAELKRLARHCKFPATWLSEALKTQLIVGIMNNDLRLRLFEKTDTDVDIEFDKLVEFAIQFEISKSAASDVPSSFPNHASSIHGLKSERRIHLPKRKFFSPKSNSNSCSHCRYNNHTSDECYFKDSKCNLCGEIGHISPICPSRRKSSVKPDRKYSNFERRNIKHVSDIDSDSTTNDIFNIFSGHSDKIFISLFLEDKFIKMECDTGAGVSAMSLRMFRLLFPNKMIQPSSTQLTSFCGNKCRLLGVALISKIKFKDTILQNQLLHILDDEVETIIGRQWLRGLNIIDSQNNINLQINKVELEQSIQNEISSLQKKYSTLFDGKTGKAKNFSANINVNEKTSPIFLKARVVPYAIRNEVEQGLFELERDGIIERTESVTWGTPIVPVIKEGRKIRICADYKSTINPHMIEDKYPIPNVDDILSKLNGGKYFAKLDIQTAYLNIPVNDKSAEIQTISTHIGNFKVNRLFFGIKNAPHIWQRYIDNLIGNLDGVSVFFDDIKIQGATPRELLQRLESVLQILLDNDLKLNKEKCKFFETSIKYLGYCLDENGIHTTPDKVKAILNASQPENVSELRSLLGLINYYGKFLPHLASILAPLHELLKSNIKYKWSSNCARALATIKAELSSDRVLVPYNPNLPLRLATDASSNGVGAVLSHIYKDGSEHPIFFISKTLSETERKYSQIDREALAINWAIKKLFVYLFGRKFTLITDHKPLTQIFHPSKSLPQLSSTRMQHYALFLSSFDFDIQYRTSKMNANADFFSRFPLISKKEEKIDVHEILQIEQMELLPITLREIQREIMKDKKLSDLYFQIQNGVNTEFNISNGVLIRGIRTVIPKSLQDRIMEELHEGHIGIVRMKSLARQFCYWEGIDQDIENLAKSCLSCQNKLSDPPQIFHPWEVPNSAWNRIHVDFAEFDNKKYLIIVDSYSKWVEVLPMNKTTSEDTVDALRTVFARFGLPHVIVSDNGPQFTSSIFEKFTRRNGILHKLTAPYHPKSNGQAERFVRTFKNSMKCLKEGSIYARLSRFLLSFRRAPNAVTGRSPSELMFGRTIRSRLDLLKSSPISGNVNNSHNFIRRSSFQIGERVLIKMFGSHENKWIPGIITRINGSVSYEIKLEKNGQVMSLALSALLVLASADDKENAVTDTKTADAELKSTRQLDKRGLELGYGGGDHDFGGHDLGGGEDYGGHSYGGGEHEHNEKTVTVYKKVPVPYPVEKSIPVPVEKKVPVPVQVHVPQPYPVEKKIPYPVKVPVHVSVPVHKPYPVEKQVPYPVKVHVDKPYAVKVLVPQPVPVVKTVHVPYKVHVPAPYPVEKKVYYPVKVPVHIPKPYPVEKIVPYPVKVAVDRPYPVHIPQPYPVHVEKKIPYPVEKPIPYPVKVTVDRPVPYPVEKPQPYPVKVPVPAPYPVEKKVPVPVEKPVPYPVKIPVFNPVPVPIYKKVPYEVEKPVAVPVKVLVPIKEEHHEYGGGHEEYSGGHDIGGHDIGGGDYGGDEHQEYHH